MYVLPVLVFATFLCTEMAVKAMNTCNWSQWSQTEKARLDRFPRRKLEQDRASSESVMAQPTRESRKLMAQPTVAYCINGLSRTLQYPMVYRSIACNLIQAFGGASFVFASIGTKMSTIQEVKNTHRDAEKAINVLRLVHALDYLNLVGLHLDTVTWKNLQDMGVEKSNCSDITLKGHIYIPLLMQVARTFDCFSLVQEYEIRNVSKFTYLWHVRPDMTWFKPVKHYSDAIWDPNKITLSSSKEAFNDHAVFGDRDLMEMYWFKRLQWHMYCCNGIRQHDVSIPAASGLPKYFKLQNVAYTIVDLPAVIVRTHAQYRGLEACGPKWHLLGRNKSDCMAKLYENGTGMPHDSDNGAWWGDCKVRRLSAFNIAQLSGARRVGQGSNQQKPMRKR